MSRPRVVKSSQRQRTRGKAKTTTLLRETLPLNDVRREYPRLLETLLNHGEAGGCERSLRALLSDAAVLTVSAVEAQHPFAPVYQEVRGVGPIANYLDVYLSAVPDLVFSLHNTQFFKRAVGGGSEIHSAFSFSGSVIHRVVVEHSECCDELHVALSGLETLATLAAQCEKIDTGAAAAAEAETSSEEREDSRGEPLSLSGGAGPQQALFVPADKQRVSVGDMDILLDKHQSRRGCEQLLVAGEKTRFRIGERLSLSRRFATSGRVLCLLNADKQVTRIDVTFSAQLALQSSELMPSER